MASEDIKIIGGKKNFWLYSKTEGYDLTHPSMPTSPQIIPRIRLETTKAIAAIDPAKTALVVVDLQNYFLSPLLGRPPESLGTKAVDRLVKYAIPACRKASIPIVWLNWGLTEQDIEEMPPAILRGFAASTIYNGQRQISGLGSQIGPLILEDGSEIEGGRVLMREQWNSALYFPLEEISQSGDIFLHKNRLSGFWGGTGVEDALKSRGIRTLLFSGVNTDQCVGSSLQDASTKGWDCILLSDGCATTSPMFAKQCIEYNVEKVWGFLTTCEEFANSVNRMVALN
jgi:nicotinamidase-related amidase